MIMKKDNWKEVKDKYWQGKSSLKEERLLKDKGYYFERLQEAKAEKMDWTFEEFLAKAEAEPQQAPAKRKTIPLWKYAGAAAAMLLIGFALYHAPLPQQNGNKETIALQKETAPGDSQHKDLGLDVNVKEKAAPDMLEQTKETLVNRADQPAKEAAPTGDSADERPMVLVNGKPVYDEEAIKIIEASLYVVTSNLKEGKHAIEKIKHLNIKL